MPTFAFVARDDRGQEVTGVRAANSRQEMIAKLRTENLVLTSLNQEGSAIASATNYFSEFTENLLKGKVSQADLMVCTRQFAAMLNAGIALTECLQTLAHSTGNPRLRDILMSIRTDVQRGRSLTESLKKYPHIFGTLFTGVIQAGESSGSLAQNVKRLADYLERKEKFRRKLRAATTYPLFVASFLSLMTAGIFLFLIPRFKEMFEEFHANLPQLTRVMMGISTVLKENILIILPALVIAIIGLMAGRKTRRGAQIWDRIVLRIPFFGKLFLHAAVARMSMTLSTLLSNGIPLTDALLLAINTLGNTELEKGCADARKDVMKGRGLAESLSRVPSLPRLLPRMVRVGEESGTLSDMLEDVSGFYDQEVDQALGQITAIIEPVLIVSMGSVVLVTVLAIYLPIFNAGKMIRGG